MNGEKYIVIVGGSGTLGTEAALIDHPRFTAPLDLGPPRIYLTLRREEPIIPDFHFPTLRRSPKRDWEQRERKRRRK